MSLTGTKECDALIFISDRGLPNGKRPETQKNLAMGPANIFHESGNFQNIFLLSNSEILHEGLGRGWGVHIYINLFGFLFHAENEPNEQWPQNRGCCLSDSINNLTHLDPTRHRYRGTGCS